MILTILSILYLRLRNNPLELLLVFVMPVIFFSIFAAIFSNGIATGGDKKLRVGWISNRDTALGFQLLGFLEQNSSLICTRLNSSADETTSDAITSDPTIADQTTSDQLVSDQPALDQTNCDAPANQTADEVDLNDSDSDSVLDDATIESKISDAQKSGRYDLIIRLPADFPNRLVEVSDNEDQPVCQVSLVTDGQNPMAVSMVTSIVKGFFAQKRAAVAAEQLMSLRTSSGLAADVDVPGAGDRPVPPQAMVPGSAASGNRPQFFDAAKEPTDVFVNDKNADWIQTNPDGVNSVNGQEGVPSEWAIAPDKPPSENPTQLLETALADKAGSENHDAVNISVENPQAASQENPRIAMYAAGIAVLFLLFSATGNAAALLEEAESGTLDRILVSKAGLFHIVTGKWLGILLLGCLQITVMFLWAEVAFKIQLGKHLIGFCVMTFSTAAATASFAMLLATLCKTRAQLNAVSVVIILSMSAVGGSMIPRFAMSDRMKEIGRWTFNAWALDGYQKVFWYQSPLSSLQAEVTVLLGSSVVLGVLTLMLSGRWKRG